MAIDFEQLSLKKLLYASIAASLFFPAILSASETRLKKLPVETFPVGVWLGPPSDHNELHHWQTLSNAGFNFAGPNRLYSDEDHLKALEFCSLVGLQYLIRDDRLRPGITRRSDWHQIVEGVVNRYKDHPATFGYYIEDEPNAEMFANIERVASVVRGLDDTHYPYVNLHPSHASATQLGLPNYADYVREFVDTVNLEILSFDHYPLSRTDEGYFENLSLIYREAQRKHMLPWAIIQGAAWGRRKVPSLADLRWQVFVALAHGMKAIQYYFYWPPVDKEGYVNGMVDRAGRPQLTYESVKQVNSEIYEIGEVLSKLTLDSVQLDRSRNVIQSTFSSTDGTKYFMVVNNDREYSQNISLPASMDLEFLGPGLQPNPLVPGAGKLFLVKQ